MGLGQNIKNARVAIGITQEELATRLNLSKGNISKYESGSLEPNTQTLLRISQILKVSIDSLLDNDTAQTAPLTAKDEKDIEKILQQTREQLESQDGLMFDGDPASKEAIDSILAAMELGLQAAKQRNKEKYTPKKYKK